MKGSDLLDRFNADRDAYNERKVAEAVRQMLQAVAYCHAHGVVHRDLKLENFCLTDDSENARIKLIDFGLSARISGATTLSHACGSLLYVAPEVLQNNYTSKCDVWSMGIITYGLLWGRPPFKGRDDMALCNAILRGRYEIPQAPKVSANAENFIDAVLQRKPQNRVSAEEALKHKWIEDSALCPVHPLGKDILEGMKVLSKENSLKQALLGVLAPIATAKEVSRWAQEFEILDVNGTGVVNVKDLAQLLVDLSMCGKEEAQSIANGLADSEETISYSTFLTACLQSHMEMCDMSDLHSLFERLKGADGAESDRVSLDALRHALGDDVINMANDMASSLMRRA